MTSCQLTAAYVGPAEAAYLEFVDACYLSELSTLSRLMTAPYDDPPKRSGCFDTPDGDRFCDPYSMVIKRGDTQVLALLLDHGLDPDTFFQYYHRGETLLHIAIKYHQYECVKLLLAHGANPYFASTECKEPFEYSQESSTPAITQLLKDHGAASGVDRQRKARTGPQARTRTLVWLLVVALTVVGSIVYTAWSLIAWLVSFFF